MSECSIERIDVDAFADLTSLQWLDLSNNHIKVEMSLYWEFPWVPWESHGNGNSYSSFIGMGMEGECGDGNGKE